MIFERNLCVAINASGRQAHHKNSENNSHTRGLRCETPALPQDDLCWVHRKTVQLGLGTEAEVKIGRRRK